MQRRSNAAGLSPRAAKLAAAVAVVVCVATARAAEPPRRVVSAIPAVTEMIFAMGDGDRLVGVSSYDAFPPEVARIAKIGGLLDPNVERILALKPDLVILYATQIELKQRLDRARIPYYSYEHRNLSDVITTMRAIGARLGAPAHGEALASDMERAISEVRHGVTGAPRPRTLLVFEREAASLSGIYASGGYGFLHDLLEIAGGTDVFADIKQQSVQATTEMILGRRPDVIIELRYGDILKKLDIAKDIAAWNTLASLPAVKNHRVHVLVGDQFVVPGPRLVDALRQLVMALHSNGRR
jgi:iron complex transport system substrate-binding protein